MRATIMGLVLAVLWLPGAARADALDSFLQDLRTWHAEFEQNQFDEGGAILEHSTGTVDLQRPGKFRWEYLDPYRQLIVADSQQIWIYDQDLEQVTLKDFTAALGNTPALLLTSDQKIDESFTVSALPQEDEFAHFELIPKDENAQFQSLRLSFQGDLLKQIELQDNLGQTTLISFHTQQRNPALSAELFVFTPPEGVDIIDGRE